MAECRTHFPIHDEPPTPFEADPVDVLRQMAQDMAEALNRENPEERHAALLSLLLDQGAADYMGRCGDVFLRGKACEAARHLIDDEGRAAVAQHLFAGERLVDDVQATLRSLRGPPDFVEEYVATLVARVSFGASLLPPDGTRDAALRDLLPPETTCPSIVAWAIAPVIAETADAVARMESPALKLPILRALLAPEARLAVERSGELATILQTARAAAGLPADEMFAAWRDLFSVKVCKSLNARGSHEQVLWAKFAVNALPDGEAKKALLRALDASDLSSSPQRWCDLGSSTGGDGSDCVSVHWSDVDEGAASAVESRSTSSATPSHTPRGGGDHSL